MGRQAFIVEEDLCATSNDYDNCYQLGIKHTPVLSMCQVGEREGCVACCLGEVEMTKILEMLGIFRAFALTERPSR